MICGQKHNQYLSKFYWSGKHYLWTRGYFVTTIGDVSEKTLQAYIENQGQNGFIFHPKGMESLCRSFVKRFYKTLFRYYLRILWSFSAIKDEELLDLKTKYLNTKMDKMFQNTMINGNTVKLITPDKVSEILHPWLIRKQES